MEAVYVGVVCGVWHVDGEKLGPDGAVWGQRDIALEYRGGVYLCV